MAGEKNNLPERYLVYICPECGSGTANPSSVAETTMGTDRQTSHGEMPLLSECEFNCSRGDVSG